MDAQAFRGRFEGLSIQKSNPLKHNIISLPTHILELISPTSIPAPPPAWESQQDGCTKFTCTTRLSSTWQAVRLIVLCLRHTGPRISCLLRFACFSQQKCLSDLLQDWMGKDRQCCIEKGCFVDKSRTTTQDFMFMSSVHWDDTERKMAMAAVRAARKYGFKGGCASGTAGPGSAQPLSS